MNRSTGQKPKTGRSPQDAELFATPEGQKYFKWFLTENAEQIKFLSPPVGPKTSEHFSPEPATVSDLLADTLDSDILPAPRNAPAVDKARFAFEQKLRKTVGADTALLIPKLVNELSGGTLLPSHCKGHEHELSLYGEIRRKLLLDSHPGPFFPDDVSDPAALIATIRAQADPVSQYLWHRFSTRRRQTLMASRLTAQQQRSALIAAINFIVIGRSIYDPQRFANTPPAEVRRFCTEPDPEGWNRMRLNRLLLENAYPLQIACFNSSDNQWPLVCDRESSELRLLNSFMELFRKNKALLFAFLEAAARTPWRAFARAGTLRDSWLFREEDLPDFTKLADRLQKPSDDIARYIVGRFSDGTKAQLQQHNPLKMLSVSLQSALIEELNRIIQGKLIDFDEHDPQNKYLAALHARLKYILGGKSQSPINTTIYNKLFLVGVFPVELDNPGRLKVPSLRSVLERAGITDNSVSSSFAHIEAALVKDEPFREAMLSLIHISPKRFRLGFGKLLNHWRRLLSKESSWRGNWFLVQKWDELKPLKDVGRAEAYAKALGLPCEGAELDKMEERVKKKRKRLGLRLPVVG